MADGVKVTQTDLDAAKTGIQIQFESMFDAQTQTQLRALGIERFLDHMIKVRAQDSAYIRFYANCLNQSLLDNQQ
jgi:hypothetical protein